MASSWNLSSHASLSLCPILLSFLLVSCLIGINCANLRLSNDYPDGQYRLESANLPSERYKYALAENDNLERPKYQLELEQPAPDEPISAYDKLMLAVALQAALAKQEPEQQLESQGDEIQAVDFRSSSPNLAESRQTLDLSQDGLKESNSQSDSDSEDFESKIFDKLDLTEQLQQQQQQPATLTTPQIGNDDQSLDQSSQLDEESQASQRAKPIVSTLVGDEDDDGATRASTRNSTVPANESQKPASVSMGKLVERESDRKEKQPNWRNFLDRIYEAVFGGPAANTKDQQQQQQTGSEKTKQPVTKPSVVSDQKESDSTGGDNKRQSGSEGENQILVDGSGSQAKTKTKTINEVRFEDQERQAGSVKRTSSSSSSSTSNVESRQPVKNNKDKKATTTTINASKSTSQAKNNQQEDLDSSNNQIEELDQQMEPDVTLANGKTTTTSNEEQEETKYSMMRKSTMVLPGMDLDQAEALGHDKYQPIIYTSQLVNQPNWHAARQPQAFTHHFHTVGQPIYGAYPTAQQVAAAAAGSGMAGQPYGPYGPNGLARGGNDLYFLVVVGAFCVMAMAMILAAGLFVYRIQQSRKTCTETEYPTYGVVGPNNVVGAKLGVAPSFVGGYFAQNAHAFGMGKMMGGKSTATGNSTEPSDGFNSPNDSGIGGVSNSKSSGKKSSSDQRPPSFMASQQNAARMYHYQHQKQQMITSERNSSGRHTSASDLDSEEENEDGNYTVYECPGLASAHDMEIKNPLFHDDRSP